MAVLELAAAAGLAAGFVLLWRSADPADSSHSAHPTTNVVGAVTVALLSAAMVLGGWLFARSIPTWPRDLEQIERWRVWWLATAVVVAGLALLPQSWHSAIASHLAMMAQLMALMVLAPALLALTTRAPLNRNPSRRGSGHLIAASGIAYVAVLYFWHVPAVHQSMMANRAIQAALVASVAVTGLLFFRTVLGQCAAGAGPAASRTVLLVGGASGILGLALLLSPYPLMSSDMSPWGLGPVADQRLAGVLMMLVDLLVFIPLARRLAWLGSPRPGSPRPDSPRPDSPRPDSTGPDSAGPDSMRAGSTSAGSISANEATPDSMSPSKTSRAADGD